MLTDEDFSNYRVRGGTAGRQIPPAERLYARTLIVPFSECWLWTGPTGQCGYGQISIDGTLVATHRFAYELEFGPIPDGLSVLHSCDTPNCIRPLHLSIGDQGENMRQMVQRGRHRNPCAEKTHCKHGHEFSKENTRMTRDGKRVCRACARDRYRRRAARAAEEDGDG